MTSTSYNRRMKRLIAFIQQLHPSLARIPAPLPRPGSEALRTPKLGDAKKDAARKEWFGVEDAKRLDSSTVRYWLERATDDVLRRSRS